MPQHPDEIPKSRYGGDKATPGIQPRWWLSSTPARDMVAVAQYLDKEQVWRRRANTIYDRLYTGRQLRNVYDYKASSPSSTDDPMGLATRLGLNVIQAVIDTIAAKIVKNRPRTYLLTEGGSWGLQRQSELLMRFLDGLRMSQAAYETGRRACLDAETTGTGIVKVSPDTEGATVSIERVIPDSLITNDAECVNGKPRTLYQRHLLHRATLEEMYASGTGEKAIRRGNAIAHADGWDAAKDTADPNSEMVWVYEGWSIRGKHVIALDHEDGELSCTPWDKDYHPFAIMRWRTAPTGFWGIGLAEDLIGIQLEINKLLQRLQETHHLMAVPRIFTRPGAKLKKNQLTNEVGVIIECEEEPKFLPGVTVPAAVYQHLWDLRNAAFEIAGVSQLDASGKKPEGLDAAVALQEYRDIGTERFVLAGQAYEQLYVDIDRLAIRTAREMYERNVDIRVKAPGTKFISTIPWSKVNLEEDSYEMKAWPTSLLPASPAFRLQRVQQLYEGGLIPDRETAMSLLDAPDLESALSLQLSAIEDIKRILELITDEGEYEPPEPFVNLALGARMAHSMFLKMRQLKGFPEARLEMLVRFGDACEDLAAETAPVAPAPVDPMAAMPAAPGAPAALPPAPGLPLPTEAPPPLMQPQA